MAEVVLRHEHQARGLLPDAASRHKRLRVVRVQRIDRSCGSQKVIGIRRFRECRLICVHSLRVNRKHAIERNRKPRSAKAEQIRLHRIALLKNKVVAIAAAPLTAPPPRPNRPETHVAAFFEWNYDLQPERRALPWAVVTNHPCVAIKGCSESRIP